MKSDERNSTLRKYYMDKDYSLPSSSPALQRSTTTSPRKSVRQLRHKKLQQEEETLGKMIRTARKLYEDICKKESESKKKEIVKLWQQNLITVDGGNQATHHAESSWKLKREDDGDTFNESMNFVENLAYVEVSVVGGDKEEPQVIEQSTPIITIQALAPIPPVLDWTSIPFNIQVEDGKYLTNIPFLGDHIIERDLRFIDEVVGHYKGNVHQEHRAKKNELDDEHFMGIVSKIEQASRQRRTRKQSKELELDDSSENEEKGNDSETSSATTPEMKQPVTKAETCKTEFPATIPSMMVFTAISKAFKGIGTEAELQQRYENLTRQQTTVIASAASSSGIRNPIPVPNIDGLSSKSLPRESSLCSYHSLFCRRCYKYDCQQHAEEDHVDPKYLKKTPAALEQGFGDCKNENCWKKTRLLLTSTKSRQEIRNTWTSSERSLFRSLLDPFQNNFCAIAEIIVTKNCEEVYDFAKTEDNPAENDKKSIVLEKVRKRNKKFASVVQTKPSSASKRRGTRRWINNFKKAEKHPLPSDIEKGSILGELPARFVPCIHENGGECDLDCKCRKNKTACEKFCTCSLNCANRFPGCRCTSTCDSKRCICFAAARECDPDLCFGCGAHELEISNMTCRNANIQRKLDKHLLWGPSDVSGWGIFLKFDVQKNDFISEYRGELVSQEEADRRGLVYDKVQHTFLFELNDHFVIDATRKGNKTRFANSSKVPNCFAKRVLVNGDHRIGIYAKRNICSGEELFYDYENVLEKQAKSTSCV